MRTEILQEAEDELNESIAHYEDVEAGLGQRLKEEARAAILWIKNNPDLPRVRPQGLPARQSEDFPVLRRLFHLG